MIKELNLVVNEDLILDRLDKVIAENFEELTRTMAQRLIESGKVFINNKVELKSYKVQPNDNIKIFFEKQKRLPNIPQNLPINIVYEDEYILVVNKSKGMVVHPAVGHTDRTLVNALLFHCKDSLSGINGVVRPGIVHRLDKDTSGLLVVAKNDFAHRGLARQIKAHTFTREYEAVVYGDLKSDTGRIDAPIGRHKRDRKKMTVRADCSKEAITNYRVIKRFGDFTHVRLMLETGRTHQIRVHMAYIGHPVAGDFVYGPKNNVIKELRGQCLHAKMLGFNHPATNEYLEFETELPEYFQNFLQVLA